MSEERGLPSADDVRGILKGYEPDDPEATLERLAAGLRERDIIPGRNPDGVNDDPEKALAMLDAWKEHAESAEAKNRELVEALWECLKQAGADPSYADDAQHAYRLGDLPKAAVEAVKELREEYNNEDFRLVESERALRAVLHEIASATWDAQYRDAEYESQKTLMSVLGEIHTIARAAVDPPRKEGA